MAISDIPLMLHRADVVTNEDKDAFVEAAEITFDHLSNVTVGEMNTLGTNVRNSEANITAKKIAIDESEQNVSDDTAIVVQKASEVLDYVIPEEATYNSTAIDTKNNKQNEANLSGYGIVLNNNINEIRPQDIFVEVDVPNVVRLSEEAKQGQVWFTDGLHDMDPSDFELPLAPFASGSTDELISTGDTLTNTIHNKADIIIAEDNPNDIYICLTDGVASGANITTDTTNFKSIPHVTKQIALLVEKTSSGTILNTVKPLVDMYGEESVETFETDIFTELGCTQVAGRVWTDDSSEFILLSLRGYLNAGSTQTFFNTYGRAVKGTNNGLTSGATSLYDSFVGQTSGTISGTSGCSDDRFYDKTYLEGQGGLVCFAIPNAKTPTYKHMDEVKRNLTDGYIENGVEIIELITSIASNVGVSSDGNVRFDLGDFYVEGYRYYLGSAVSLWQTDYEAMIVNNTTNIAYRVSGLGTYRDISLTTSNTQSLSNGDSISFVMTRKSPYLVTQGSHTHTDLIGSPDNYPTELKNLLVSGGSVGFMNALLVGQDGVSAIPTGSSQTFIMSSKFIGNFLSTIRTLDNGGTWSDLTASANTTWNKDIITNDFTINHPTTTALLHAYTTQNQSAIPISTPQPIEHPDRDLIATNHHSEHAYNGLVYAATGKIATGSSFESKSLENIIQDENKNIITTPTHNAITLDANSIVGVKALITQISNATQIFTQELIYDVDWGDTDEFDSLTESIQPGINGDVQHKILIKPSSVRI